MGRPFLRRPTCPVCGEVCKRLDRTFCSRKCRGVSQRGQEKIFMHGNQFAYQGETVTVWAHYKRMQALIPEGPCEKCGATKTCIHHIDHNPRNTVRENLMRLCRPCHASHHHGKTRAR